MKATELQTNEYLPYYSIYIDKANNYSLLDGLKKSLDSTLRFFASIPEHKFDFAYEDGKWTIKEVIQHIIDTERIFAYRALRFARQDQANLPGYEQDDYAITSMANDRAVKSLIEEYKLVRQSTIHLFESFTDKMLVSKGKASGSDISVRAIGFICIGHEIHHSQVIEECYL